MLDVDLRRLRAMVRQVATGPLRSVAAPTFAGVVELQVAVSRGPLPAPDTSIDGALTAVIKTFERPVIARRLVDSIRRRYPSLPVIVVDDSREPRPIPTTESVVLPYDSGVSAGRQAGLERVRTPFVLIMDDDFVFFRRTDLASAVARLRRRANVDILGGQLIDLPLLRRQPPPLGQIFPTPKRPIEAIGSAIDGLRVCDKVTNFYVARTDRLRSVGWDPQLRMLDHADFFTRALGVLVTVFDPELQALHAQTPFDRSYMARRGDIARDQLLLRARWGPRRA